jgi:hypothetical protein
MFDKNFDYIKARHQTLLDVAEKERLAHDLRDGRPSMKDLVLLRMGNLFITFGKKIKDASAACEEISLAEFSREIS